jgi:hypothetical protein
MARAPSKIKERDEIELHPDAWDRFTEFVKRIAKAGPQHRQPKPKNGTTRKRQKEKS